MLHNLALLMSHTSDTVYKLEDTSSNLSAVSEEVFASSSNLTERINSISDKTRIQAMKSQNSTLHTTELGAGIDALQLKNQEMKNQGDIILHSLNKSNSSIEFLKDANIETQNSFTSVTGTVEDLILQVSNISSIINLIENISTQTSLLSLNAFIEAARAGEAGKGFSVVASEIKNLADDVQNSINDISHIITNINAITDVTKEVLKHSQSISEGQTTAYSQVEDAFISMKNLINEMLTITLTIHEEIDVLNHKKYQVLENMEDINNEAQDIAEVTKEATTSIQEQTQAFESVSLNAEELIQYAINIKKSLEQFSTKNKSSQQKG